MVKLRRCLTAARLTAWQRQRGHEIHTAAAEEASKRPVAAGSTESADAGPRKRTKVAANVENMPGTAATEQFRVVEMTKIEGTKTNQVVVNVTRSETSQLPKRTNRTTSCTKVIPTLISRTFEDAMTATMTHPRKMDDVSPAIETTNVTSLPGRGSPC